MPPHYVKQHLRRRRQSLEIAGSSTEDTSDGSGIRRKRSNTTTSPSPTQTAHVHTKFKALPPVEKPSDRSDVGLSPDATNAKVTLKKLCKRQSSENGIEGLYRSTKQRATEVRRDHDSFVVDRRQDWPATTKLEKSCVHDRSIKLESESKPAEPVHTKLFFTSTYKVLPRFSTIGCCFWNSPQMLFTLMQFTDQEVEAMFSVYGDFESAELVRSFGRVKTMAYIIYSKVMLLLLEAFGPRSLNEPV